ncbi:S1 family peptidase [Streptomyces sp. NPDC005761]|uniref:S1 family peptidase n=1 Tax=Streptomyces sp. NPDC005761 TaxID=3157066 RepID=UPI0033F5B685
MGRTGAPGADGYAATLTAVPPKPRRVLGEIHAPQTCTGCVHRRRGRAGAGRTDRQRVRRPLPPPVARRGGPVPARPAEGHAARSRTQRRPGDATHRQRVPRGRRGRRPAALTRRRFRRRPAERRRGGTDGRHDRCRGHRHDHRAGARAVVVDHSLAELTAGEAALDRVALRRAPKDVPARYVGVRTDRLVVQTGRSSAADAFLAKAGTPRGPVTAIRRSGHRAQPGHFASE